MSLFAKNASAQLGLFKKQAGGVASGLFKKGGVGERSVDRLSHTLAGVGRNLGVVHSNVGKVLDSGVVNGIAHLAGPTGMTTLNSAKNINNSLGQIAKLSSQGAHITNRHSYRGGAADVAISMLERGRKLAATGANSNLKFA